MDRYGQYVKAPAGGVKEVRGALPSRNARSRAAAAADRRAEHQRRLGAGAGRDGRSARHAAAASCRSAQSPRPSPAARRRRRARRGGGPPAGPRLYGGTELTPEGEKAAAAFKREDNPRFSCQTTSIIFDWTFDGPVNRITQNKDTIVIQYGQMNLKRTIYMNLKTHPAGVKPTRAGHSIGRWEGDTLVVDTVGFLPGFLNTPVRNSDKLHVVERFTLDPETMRLTRAYTADDPVYLKGQYTGQDIIGVADQPYAEDQCKEQGFINYSKQVQR